MQLSDLIIDDRHQARFKIHHSAFNIYPGHAQYLLVQTGEGLKIKSKKAVLDVDALCPHGKISIIL